MSKHIEWLHEQIGRWLADGLIDSDQAGRIRGLYPAPKAGPPWGIILFAGLGAVVAGLGVILLFAYNWHAMPKVAKLAVVFFSLVSAHAGGLWLFTRPDWRRPLGEAICLLGTMLFGAGIWLIAQIYHIDEHFPNGFLIWGLGALALAWAMPSVAQGLAAATLLAIWNCSESWGFQLPPHYGPVLIVASVGGLAWRLSSPFLLLGTIAAFYFALVSNGSVVHERLIFGTVFSTSALVVGLALLPIPERRFPFWKTGLLLGGWPVFLVCLYLLTFVHPAEELTRGRSWQFVAEATAHRWYRWAPAAAVLMCWGFLGWAFLNRKRSEDPPVIAHEDWLVPLMVMAYLVFVLLEAGAVDWLVPGICNLVFLAICASWMARGCMTASLQLTVMGSVLLVALVAARYFDLFESLAIRGVVFLVVGGVLIAEGVLYTRARRQKQSASEVKP